MADDYKNLNLDPEVLEQNFISFCEINEFKNVGYRKSGKYFRAQFKPEDQEIAMVEIMPCGDGTTTIHYKLGKNRDAGMQLAEYYKSSADPDAQKNVSLMIDNVDERKFSLFRDELTSVKAEGDDSKFSIVDHSDNDQQSVIKVTSYQYKCTVTATYYKTNDRLHLQGKPLYTFKQMMYLLSEDIGLNGFIEIIYKKDVDEKTLQIDKGDIDAEIVNVMPNAFMCFSDKVKDMLRTSYKARLLDIEWPDYSMLLFNDLRALEASIKQGLIKFNFTPGDAAHGVGTWFKPREHGSDIFVWDESHYLGCDKTKESLGQCYTLYKKQRHTLFHTEDVEAGSRTITSKEQANSLASEVASNIDALFKNLS